MKTLANIALLFALSTGFLVAVGFLARFYWELLSWGWGLL